MHNMLVKINNPIEPQLQKRKPSPVASRANTPPHDWIFVVILLRFDFVLNVRGRYQTKLLLENTLTRRNVRISVPGNNTRYVNNGIIDMFESAPKLGTKISHGSVSLLAYGRRPTSAISKPSDDGIHKYQACHSPFTPHIPQQFKCFSHFFSPQAKDIFL